MSDFNITSFTKLINDLTGVVNNPDDYLYWGQVQIMINSGHLVSTCFNEFDQESLPSVPTQDLLDFVIEAKNFKEFYVNLNNLKDLVGQAFNTIKSNPTAYKAFSNSNVDFSVTINDVVILLTLSEQDFNLSQSQYVNQLKVF